MTGAFTSQRTLLHRPRLRVHEMMLATNLEIVLPLGVYFYTTDNLRAINWRAPMTIVN